MLVLGKFYIDMSNNAHQESALPDHNSLTLRDQRWILWIGYAIAAGSVILLTALLAAIQPYFPTTSFRIPYIVAVVFIAYYFGAGPAALAAVLGVLSFAYLYVPPAYSIFPIAQTAEHWAVYVSLAIGMTVVGSFAILLRRVMLHAERVMADLAEVNIALLSEIREREKAEEALERSELRFRTTFERAGIGMTVIDMRGYVLEANPAFAALTGYDPEELIGMNVERYAYPEDLAHGNQLLYEMIEGKRDFYQIEKRYITKDGSIIWGRLTASIARNPEPEPPFIIGMIEDITERKLAEQRERELESDKLEFYRRTITAATDGKLIITDRPEIDRLCENPLEQWEMKTPEDLPGARRTALSLMATVGIDEDRAWDFATCIGEAATNAIKHAGGGRATLCRLSDGLLFTMSDDGPGIPALTLPDVALRKMYSTAGTLGMGYKVMMSFGDRVYLATGPEGTTVAVEIRTAKEPDTRSYVIPETWSEYSSDHPE